jgi:hypothetical protein
MTKWINECHTDPCQSGGTCEDLEDGYRLINFRKSFFFTNLSGYFHGNSSEMTCHEKFLFKFSDNSQGFPLPQLWIVNYYVKCSVK